MASKRLKEANGNSARSVEERALIISKAAKAYGKFLDALEFNWRADPNSSNTPNRVAKSFVNDLISGCYSSGPDITSFPNRDSYNGMVFQGNIPLSSLCSHHHLPFTGVVHVAYLPKERVIGLSKLNRIVEFYGRRPQIQEGLTMQIHNAISQATPSNLGVAVVVSATHSCACIRGVKHQGCVMKTSKLSGCFDTDPSTRQEFYSFIDQLNKK